MSEQHSHQKILRFIDFYLLFRGHISATEVQEEFAVNSEIAINALKSYEMENSESTNFDLPSERYFQSTSFKPIYEHDGKQFIGKLMAHFAQCNQGATNTPMQSETLLNFPDTIVIARLVQAILNGNAVNVIYTSLSSGSDARDLVPHSIVDNGLRWHLRAYDRKSEEFRDFVLTRISKVTVKSNRIFEHEGREVDWQWQKQIDLVIKPHPENVRQPTAIEMDYGMINGELKINTRAALAGYLLRRWNVDCTPKAELSGSEYQLWLSNRLDLKDVTSLSIAPAK